MSNKGNALISILILALGGVFIWLYDHDTLPKSIVLLCGLAFVVPAVISLLTMFISRRSDKASAGLRLIQMVCGVGGLGLGLSIILLPDVFRPLLVYPFAALMIVGGAFQVFQISHKYRPVDYPAWMYIAPILILAAGVVVLCTPSLHAIEYEKWIVLITGIAGVLYGISGLLISILPHRLPPLRNGQIVAGDSDTAEKGTQKNQSAIPDTTKTDTATSHPSADEDNGHADAPATSAENTSATHGLDAKA